MTEGSGRAAKHDERERQQEHKRAKAVVGHYNEEVGWEGQACMQLGYLHHSREAFDLLSLSQLTSAGHEKSAAEGCCYCCCSCCFLALCV